MSCKPAIPSMSLGRAWVHDLDVKISEASKAGFKGIEIFYEDLEYLAKRYGGVEETHLIRAATEIAELCNKYDLEVVGLQPFLFYEGLLDRQEHAARIKKLKIWFKLVKILRTDTIQIPSNFLPEGTTGDLSLIVNDMIEVADLGSQESPPVRFAYESMAWGTHIDTWEQMWAVVSRVNRPNFGCCLDTFHIAGRVWADPESETGMTQNADHDLHKSLSNLATTIDAAKVFYIQVVDGQRLEQPLVKGQPLYVEGQLARMTWSRNCRLFAYEQDKGAYMPVTEVARVLIEELGFKGWVSMELFNSSMEDSDPSVPNLHAQRGYRSWETLAKELDL